MLICGFEGPAFPNLRELPEDHMVEIPPDQLIQEGFVEFSRLMRQFADADGAKSQMNPKPGRAENPGKVTLLGIFSDQLICHFHGRTFKTCRAETHVLQAGHRPFRLTVKTGLIHRELPDGVLSQPGFPLLAVGSEYGIRKPVILDHLGLLKNDMVLVQVKSLVF